MVSCRAITRIREQTDEAESPFAVAVVVARVVDGQSVRKSESPRRSRDLKGARRRTNREETNKVKLP